MIDLLCLQRSALTIASNCCQTVTEGDFALIQDALPVVSGRLQHQVRTQQILEGYRQLVFCFAGQKVSGELLLVFLQTGG